MAENKRYLDEVHQPYRLDLWNNQITSPIESEDDFATETLFETILSIVDNDSQNRPKRTMMPRRGGRDESMVGQLEKAIETLEAKLPTVDGAQKRILERVLSNVKPDEK